MLTRLLIKYLKFIIIHERFYINPNYQLPAFPNGALDSPISSLVVIAHN